MRKTALDSLALFLSSVEVKNQKARFNQPTYTGFESNSGFSEKLDPWGIMDAI